MDAKDFRAALDDEWRSRNLLSSVLAWLVLAGLAASLWLTGTPQKVAILLTAAAGLIYVEARISNLHRRWLLQHMRVFPTKSEIEQ